MKKTHAKPVAHRPVSTANLDEGYPELLAAIRHRFAALPDSPLFRVDTAGLFDGFLARLPGEIKQHYTCHACRHFVEQYGGLVTIDADGKQASAMWGSAPPVFAHAVEWLRREVQRRDIARPFISTQGVYGTPVTGPWSHLSVTPRPSRVYRETPAKSAFQREAEIMADSAVLATSLYDYTLRHAQIALDLLRAGDFYRAEKMIPIAEWFLGVHKAVAMTPKDSQRRRNLIANAAALAPAGWCHIRSGMLGTLLGDIKNGVPPAAVKRKYEEKMDPSRYLRPQAAPDTGAIDAAERLVEKLGIARSLDRRFARLDEVPTLWGPGIVETSNGPVGVFSHLRERAPAPPTGRTTMTWEKFAREVLPFARKITLDVPRGAANFAATTTALHPDAPPVIRWDRPEQRNPFAIYMYRMGSLPSQWSLVGGLPIEVVGIMRRPEHWFPPVNPADAPGAILVLSGARDIGHLAGGGLFPEILRSDLHPIRSVVEAHSARSPIRPAIGQLACGLAIGGGACDISLTVTLSSGIVANYRIDRWD